MASRINTDIIFYSSPNGNIRVEVLYENETFWLTQKRMAGLFGVEVNTINYHLKEIFKSGELQEDRVIRKIRTVRRCDNCRGWKKVQRKI